MPGISLPTVPGWLASIWLAATTGEASVTP